MPKKKILIFVILLFFAGLFDYQITLPFLYKHFISAECSEYLERQIKIDEVNVVVQIADDDCKRVLGLSNRQSLRRGAGMLFEYDNDSIRQIWMKDMNFPIDIAWVNSSLTIVGVEKNIHPSTYPKKFGAEFSAKYVIELSAGFVDTNDISVGDKVSILE